MTATNTDVYASPSRGGRPVDHSRDAAILEATRELIVEVGYDRLTIEAVAVRARAGKATLYRRWPSKADLVLDAIRERHQGAATLPDTGDLRSDLIEGLLVMASRLEGSDCDLVSGLVNAMRDDAQLAGLIRDQMVTEKRALWRAWGARAVASGQLASAPDADLLQEIVTSMFFGRTLMLGQPLDREYVTHVVDDVLLPLLEVERPRTRTSS